VQTLERIEILRDLRMGVYAVIVGINLLRAGLVLREVSLVAILDADKEGFLRSETSLIQTTGRAARHVNGTVIMYADRITDSMQRAIDETDRRRAIQDAHNKAHGIEPQGIIKEIKDLTDRVRATAESRGEYVTETGTLPLDMPKSDAQKLIHELEKQMKDAAGKWEFEKAAMLRDQIMELRAMLDATDSRPEWQKVMATEDHWEIEQLREQKAAMTPTPRALPKPVRAKAPTQRRR
jgi:excinuclease ABC subunit B